MSAIAIPQKSIRLATVWLSALWIATGLLAATSARADIYFWQDAAGTIHFSNQDAPADASLYMREIARPAKPEASDQKVEKDDDQLAKELARRQAQTQQRLDEANRRLDRALEKVDNLTESVARSQARAEAAAEAARQAEQEAAAAVNSRDEVRERAIVYAAPYRYHYKDRSYGHRRHKTTGRHSRHLNRAKKFRPQHHRNHSELERFKGHRGKAAKHRIPGPILPPEPYRIPKAYGIR
ncbi:MAG: DUF4124 domain-containing protein [Desulfobacteraceae bacterium]